MRAVNVIADSAEVGTGFSIGCFCTIGENVRIGNGVTIGNGVVIYCGTAIGDNVVVQDNVVIGKRPVKAKNSIANVMDRGKGALPPAVVGDGCIIGTAALIYRGCTLAKDCYVADQAVVRERVSIGEGTIVGRGVLIENDCSVGRKCKLEANAYITAYSRLEDDVFIAPGVVTTNDNFLGRTEKRIGYIKGVTVKCGGRVGANATLLPGRVVGEDALVAAGSVVTRDVQERKIVMGSPARFYKEVPFEQLLENNRGKDKV